MSRDRLTAAARPDLVPPYDRTAPPAIVHLGVGAFARAHLGVYADALLRAGWPATIRGISLHHPTAEAQLAPQDGLYSLTVREPGEDTAPRVLGAFTAVATGREAAVAAIADPATVLVTLTVTEKGYAPGGAPSVVAEGLARRDRSAPPPVIASLDNVAGNGSVLRAAVLEVAGAGVAGWIADAVRFPSSVVDRMVPATTAADLDEVEQHLGCRDEAAAVAERHCSWILERVDGLPPLADVGVEVVEDVAPHQQRKLWLLNGPHSALAYAGLLAGCEAIADAAADPRVAPFVARLVDDVLEVATVPDARAFADEARRRFANAALGHRCLQVGADGSEKLRQRLMPVVAERERRGLPTDRFAVVVAAWRAALPGLDDPAPAVEHRWAEVLGARAPFAAQVDDALDRLQQDGPAVLAEDPGTR